MDLTANQLIAQSDSPLLCRTINMPAGYHDEAHHHPWHQIIYPMQGTLRTQVADALYFVPGNIAVFIPAGTVHSSIAIGDTRFIGIYFSPAILDNIASSVSPFEQCQLLQLSPFLQHFIAEVVHQEQAPSPTPGDSLIRLYQVFCEQMLKASKLSLDLALPSDKRLFANNRSHHQKIRLQAKLWKKWPWALVLVPAQLADYLAKKPV